MFHPLGDKRKPAFTYRHPKQWQDIWMPEVPPGDSLSAEVLQPIHPYRCHDARRRLTLKIMSRSSLRHTRTTLIATRRPLCVPCDTSAKPPRPASTAPSEQSGIYMDFGITRCRLHVLQSLLSSFCRSRSEMVRSSRRYSSCWSWDGKGAKAKTPALSIPSTLPSISGSDPRRNWKREVIRGRSLPRCRSPVPVAGTF